VDIFATSTSAISQKEYLASIMASATPGCLWTTPQHFGPMNHMDQNRNRV
jgi:hypothetical protein